MCSVTAIGGGAVAAAPAPAPAATEHEKEHHEKHPKAGKFRFLTLREAHAEKQVPRGVVPSQSRSDEGRPNVRRMFPDVGRDFVLVGRIRGKRMLVLLFALVVR